MINNNHHVCDIKDSMNAAFNRMSEIPGYIVYAHTIGIFCEPLTSKFESFVISQKQSIGSKFFWFKQNLAVFSGTLLNSAECKEHAHVYSYMPLLQPVFLAMSYSRTKIDLYSLSVKTFIKSIDPEGLYEVHTNVEKIEQLCLIFLGELHCNFLCRKINTLVTRLLFKEDSVTLIEAEAKRPCQDCLDTTLSLHLDTSIFPIQMKHEGWDDYKNSVDEEMFVKGGPLIQVGQFAQRMIYMKKLERNKGKKNKLNESYEKIMTDINTFLSQIEKRYKFSYLKWIKNLPIKERKKLTGIFDRLQNADPALLRQRLNGLYKLLNEGDGAPVKDRWQPRQNSLVQNVDIQLQKGVSRLFLVAGAKHLFDYDKIEGSLDHSIQSLLKSSSKGYLVIYPIRNMRQYLNRMTKIAAYYQPKLRPSEGNRIDFNCKTFNSTYTSLRQIKGDVFEKLGKLQRCQSYNITQPLMNPLEEYYS